MAVSTALTLRVQAVHVYSMKTRPRLILNLVLDYLPPTFLTPFRGKEGRSAGSKNPNSQYKPEHIEYVGNTEEN
jgi:hypothetical protein